LRCERFGLDEIFYERINDHPIQNGIQKNTFFVFRWDAFVSRPSFGAFLKGG
jgi:hypothetical protein